MAEPPRLVLASGSRYRAELLHRLRLPFEVIPPDLDERALPGEKAVDLACRLAASKARLIAERHPDAIVIGSDQVAELDERAIGKPGNHERATEQLRSMSGRSVGFHTAVSVQCAGRGHAESTLASVTVRFRHLTPAEIERYLRLEQPYDCAGSAKCETLGIALLEAIESDDPTTLVGLPLIRTSAMLRRAGLDPLGVASGSP